MPFNIYNINDGARNYLFILPPTVRLDKYHTPRVLSGENDLIARSLLEGLSKSSLLTGASSLHRCYLGTVHFTIMVVIFLDMVIMAMFQRGVVYGVRYRPGSESPTKAPESRRPEIAWE